MRSPGFLRGCASQAAPVAAAVLAALVLLGSVPANGDELVPPDAWKVIHAVRALGPAEVGRDDFRDPQITADLTRPDGAPLGLMYHVTFYGCELGRDCSSVLLSLRLFRPQWQSRPPHGVLSDWNRTKLIGRAWLDGENRAVLDHPVVMGRGLPADTLAATLSAWSGAMREFAELLDFTTK